MEIAFRTIMCWGLSRSVTLFSEQTRHAGQSLHIMMQNFRSKKALRNALNLFILKYKTENELKFTRNSSYRSRSDFFYCKKQ
jgi:hypothetical protein